MPETRIIEIDFDVHRAIEMERKGFDDSPNAALRRLLKLGEAKTLQSDTPFTEGRPWSGKGVTLPHGTELKMEYNGRVYSGRIHDGGWLIDGELFDSPSGAASGVALTKRGTKTRLDGWSLWQIKLPHSEHFREIAGLKTS